MNHNYNQERKVHNLSTDVSPSVFMYDYFFNFTDKVYVGSFSPALISQLLSYCNNLRHKNNNAGMATTREKLAGDLVEEYNLNLSNNDGILFDSFCAELTTHLSLIYNDTPVKFDIEDPWVNYQKKNEHNPMHFHLGLLSFVIYLDVPEAIRQEHLFQSSRTSSRGLIQFVAERTGDGLTFNPSPGNILIFNSSHNHQVYPFYSDATRVSLAGNILSVDFGKTL